MPIITLYWCCKGMLVRVLLMGKKGRAASIELGCQGKLERHGCGLTSHCLLPARGPEQVPPLSITVSLLTSQYLEGIYSFSVKKILREKVSSQKGLVW